MDGRFFFPVLREEAFGVWAAAMGAQRAMLLCKMGLQKHLGQSEVNPGACTMAWCGSEWWWGGMKPKSAVLVPAR